MKIWAYSVCFVFAIVAANLSVCIFGPQSTVVNAFLFIGMDLTLRDYLQLEFSAKRNGVWLMLLLIGVGGGVSYLLNPATSIIAIASSVAFISSGCVDYVTFSLLRGKNLPVRITASNAVGAAVDSVVFPTVAFGVFMPEIVFGQFASKVLGGVFWMFVINKLRRK